jgi:hypothetical protein
VATFKQLGLIEAESAFMRELSRVPRLLGLQLESDESDGHESMSAWCHERTYEGVALVGPQHLSAVC